VCRRAAHSTKRSSTECAAGLLDQRRRFTVARLSDSWSAVARTPAPAAARSTVCARVVNARGALCRPTNTPQYTTILVRNRYGSRSATGHGKHLIIEMS
jgi:hypothetical protein